MRHFVIPDYDHPILPLFSPCGRWLYGSGGTFLVVWDLAGTSSDYVWCDDESGGFFMRPAVSPCGRYVAGAEDRCVVVWDIAKRGKAKWLAANASGDQISDVAFTPDGTEVLTACIEGRGGVRRWRVGNWRRKPAFATRAHCDGALAVSPDGKTVATADNGDDKPAIKLWRFPSGKLRKTITTDAESLDRLRYSPDGLVLVAQDEWKRVRVWDARTLVEVAVYEPPKKPRRKTEDKVRGLEFHPSGQYLAVGGSRVEFLDTKTWKPAVSFDWKVGAIYGIAFSSDGLLAAAGGDRGKVVVWDVDV
jgi:WD40 repeat protein